MRISTCLCGAVILLTAAMPLVLRAQFQQPTEQELNMTSDPDAPGAAAVYLNYQEIDSDREHGQDYYVRIKVLTDKGRNLATVQLPYQGGDFSIGSIAGRTIHPDGTVVPLVVKPSDLLVEKNSDGTIQQKVFTLPAVTVGSILEYSYQLRFNRQFFWHLAPEWEIQKHYFIHKAHFEFTPADMLNLIYWPDLPKGVELKKDVAGRFSLDMTNIPPIPDEEWMPPVESFLYRVRFYYRYETDPLDVNDFWKAAAKNWSKEVDRFADPTRTIHDAVNGIVSPADSDIDKAGKLYAAVEKLDNTDFSRARSESERRQLHLKEEKRAEDTWTQRSGNSNEIALLYLAMLRSAGLTAYAVKVVDRDQGVFDPSYMNLDQLDDVLVILASGGKETLLDPGEKMCPFGFVHWTHSGAEGLRQSANGPGRAVTPFETYKQNSVKRTGDIKVDEQGGITGTIQIAMTGQVALAWRQFALEHDDVATKDEFDKEIGAVVPIGVEAHLDHFLWLDQPDLSLIALVKVKGVPGSATSKRLILPGLFFESRGLTPFVREKQRIEAVDMQYAGIETNELTYHLPPGASVEGAPPNSDISWPGHAVYVVKTKADAGQIIVARMLAQAFTQAKPGEYDELRSFYQKVAASDQASLVLKLGAGQVNGN